MTFSAKAKRNSVEIGEALLNRGARIDLHNNFVHKDLPIHVAAFENNSEFIVWLASQQADLNVLNYVETALHIAASQGNYEATEALLKANADVRKLSKNGLTPYQVAKTSQIRELIKKYGGQ